MIYILLMYEEHSLLIDQPDYLKIADLGLTNNQRKIYTYLFRNKVFDGSSRTNAEISKATRIAPNNTLISLQGLVSKDLVYINDKKEYWIKRYDSINKAKALKVINQDSSAGLDQERIKRRQYFFELAYAEEEMYDRFHFIHPENVIRFIDVFEKRKTKCERILKHLRKIEGGNDVEI